MWRFQLKRKPVSPLHRELSDLKTAFAKTDLLLERMSDDFWRGGGVCCPECGVEGYRELGWKQERREKRIRQLEKKLGV